MTFTADEKRIEDAEGSNEPPINEGRLMRKIDVRVALCMSLMNMIAFLEKVNISNAATMGLKEDLDIVTGTKYNTALMIFFIPYILFEIPSNLMLKKVQPHVWLSGCAFAFGVTSICQGLVQSWGALMVIRWFLGVFESAIFPGLLYTLTRWYKRSECQWRFAFLSNSMVVSGAVGGFLASAIVNMDGLRGYRAWRWLFIIEGAATSVLAVVAFFVLPGFPADSKWLSDREKEFIRRRLEPETGDVTGQIKASGREELEVLKDYKTFLGVLMFGALTISTYGYAFFAPTIIHTYGYSVIKTQLYSVPPWAVAYIFSLLIAILSDRFQRRYAFAVPCALIAITGYGILIGFHDTEHNHVKYGALFLVACGTYGAAPLLLCWFSMNLVGPLRRSVGIAAQFGLGNLSAIISVYCFLEKDAPLYRQGYIICVSGICLAIVSATLYLTAVWHENRQRDRARGEHAVESCWVGNEQPGEVECTYRYSY